MTQARIVRAERMPDDTPHVDTVVVGAGACGLTTAIMLRDAGVACLVIERDAVPQGSTALSSGFIPAGGTQVQREAGVGDSAEGFARDIQVKARGRADARLVAAYTQAIGPTLDHLGAHHGLQFELLDGFLYPGHSVRRMHTLPERTGAALVAALERAAVQAGADLLTRSLVTELWCNGHDRVLGVGLQRPDGHREHIACDVLVLACNGFGGNPALVHELLPEMHHAPFAGHVGNDGSALAWGRALGAGLADLGGYQGHGGWAVPQGTLISWALMMEGGVQVNREGRRFHDESAGYSEAAVQVLAQPGSIAWMVFDEPVLALARGFPDFRAAEAAGAVRSADAAAALARLIGVPADALQATLQAVAPGVTCPFGRSFRRALGTPLHAVKVTGALFHTQGGLNVDGDCRVLREDGSPLPNLLAAGGAARGVSGDAVWGYLSGNGLLSAVAGGAIAARTARRLAPPDRLTSTQETPS